MHRRHFLILAGTATLGATAFSSAPVMHAEQNTVIEWGYTSSQRYADAFAEVTLDALVTAPDGRVQKIPAYWAGDNDWRIRFSAAAAGRYRFQTVCSDTANAALHEQRGEINITPYAGGNALLRHGALRLSANRKHFEHHDGKPFFWLADSWWLGMSSRFKWPDDFQLLAADRQRKGFSVIQFAVAFPCDVAPFDPRAANEAGHAWTKDFGTINPAYFDLTDLRVAHLVRLGLVPNIVGAWGYYLPFLGVEKMKRHWRYLIARYGAYPVTWTAGGEITLPWYLHKDQDGQREQQRRAWSEVARYVKQTDPYQRLLTVHPGPNSGGMRPLADMTALDFVMAQPGHSEFEVLSGAGKHLREARKLYPSQPAMIGEACFEGMHGACQPKAQRYLFWTSVLSGAPGHCYGADAIWQFNTREQPFGASPNGFTWGNTPWEMAYQWPGAAQVGAGKRILEQFDWWRMEPHQEWITTAADDKDHLGAWCAGIPGKLRLIYFPRIVAPWNKRGTIVGLEPNVTYRAAFINPLDGGKHDLGLVQARDGKWDVPAAPVLHDWLLVLEAMK